VDNTISGLATGLELKDDSGPTLVEGNRIGTDAAGAEARPNLFGIVIGPQAKARITGNVLSGNQEAGLLTESRTVDAVVEDNDVGVAGDGESALANRTGIRLDDETIAGSATGDEFVIRAIGSRTTPATAW
jgi:hypothetical protein